MRVRAGRERVPAGRRVPERVLVTGGAGFIGSHLVEALLGRGCAVTVIDDLSTGSLDNLAAVANHPRLHVQIDSCANVDVVAAPMQDVDACVHLAAVVGVRRVVEAPARALEVNVRCAQAVLQSAARYRVPLLLASSSEVYGPSAPIPFSEDQPLEIDAGRSTHSTYAVSKLHSERLALAWREQAGLPVIIARLFNTAGPRQSSDYGMVVPSLVRRALAGRSLTVHGDGMQTRCFAHVDDTVEALMRLLTAPSAIGTVCNVGSDCEISIRAFAERVRIRTGCASTIELLPYEDAYGAGFLDMRRRVPDLRRLARITEFRPQVPVDAIIDDTIAYWLPRAIL